jgi:hypothetical protein
MGAIKKGDWCVTQTRVSVAPVRRLRQGMTYANVMATIAVFVALGGTGVAATQLAKNSVTSASIKNGQVKNKDLAKNAVTSTKVKDHSLLGKDFKAGQLPQGPKGATGAQGPKGNTGLTGATGPSNGFFSTSAIADPDVTWSMSQQTLRSFSLPAGKYILNASVDANNNAASSSLAGCSIDINGSSIDDENVNPGPDGTDDGDGIAMTGGATLSSTGTAALHCSASTTSGTWESSSLTAIKVASLN